MRPGGEGGEGRWMRQAGRAFFFGDLEIENDGALNPYILLLTSYDLFFMLFASLQFLIGISTALVWVRGGFSELCRESSVLKTTAARMSLSKNLRRRRSRRLMMPRQHRRKKA